MKADRSRKRRLFLIASKLVSVITLIFFSAGTVFALPAGQQVVNGQAAFNTQGNNLTITNTPNSIINWQGFSIHNNEAVRFIQQYGSSAVLNRVIGQDPSRILGLLQSNGRVFLINPSGILFGQGARIDVNGLFASTLNIGNQDFLAGKYNFTAGAIAGSIQNQGTITTPEGGKVYLIAPDIENSGIINSPKGDVILAAGHSVQLVDSLNPDISIVVSAPENKAVNLGQIVAQSGKVGIYGGLISQKGIVNADSAVVGENGRIFFKASKDVTLDAGSTTSANGPQGGQIKIQSASGTTLVSGTATAAGNDGKGGDIQLLGKQVGLTDSAQVEASGRTGGGTVLIGGDYQGKNPAVQNAEANYVGKDAVIKADATDKGDGGKVVLWSDDKTEFYGRISARGGVQGGDGGNVEVSGKRTLVYRGLTDLRAPKGKTGTLLLDPTDFYINVEGDISGSTLGEQLDTANVTIQTDAAGAESGDIYVYDDVSWGSSTTLTLKAHNDINVDSNITNNAGGSLVLRADWDANGAGNVIFGYGGYVTLTGGGMASIYYNPPDGYGYPTNYSSNFTGVTPTAYMLVNNVDNLQNMNTKLDGTYALGKDIDATATSGWNSGAGFAPVGNGAPPLSFSGTFDGDGHTISGLYINRPLIDNVGLFGYTGGSAIIRNVGLLNGNITGQTYVGGLMGYNNGGTINNSYSTGAVTGGSYSVGGLVGLNDGTISNSYSTAAVTGDSYWVGGLVGCNYNYGSIINSYSTGAVSGNSFVGGLAGQNATTGTISNSHYDIDNVTINGDHYVTEGGLYTLQYQDWINNSMTLNIGDYSASLPLSGGYYTIGTTQGLKDMLGFVDNTSNKFRLTTNLDLSPLPGWHIPVFSGLEFNGAGYTLANLSVNQLNDDIGFIGRLNPGSTLTGVGLTNVSVTGWGRVGGLVGHNLGSITNSYSTGAATGYLYVGGLVGYNEGTISNSHYDIDNVTINGDHYVTEGGLYTLQYQDWINNSMTLNIGDYSASLPLSGGYYTIGTTQGLKDMLGFVDNTSNKFRLTTNLDLSPLPGWHIPVFSGLEFNGAGYTLANLSVNQPFNDNIGFIGRLNPGSTLTGVGLTNVSVTGVNNVGGLVGWNYDGTISNSYSTGAVTGDSYVGGLVGYNEGSITNSYSTGAVTGDWYVGGLVGKNYGSIDSSYSTGAVAVDGGTGEYVGGLVGYNEGSISNSYWDIDTSGWESSSGGTGLTTTEMMTQATFTGGDFPWDFTDTWWMSETNTRPFLRSEYSTNITNAHQLQLMALDLGASYYLANNIIDMGELTQASGLWNTTTGFVPVGNLTTLFTGTFEGNGRTISSLYINLPTTDYVGLFGYTNGATIQNVGLVNVSVTGHNKVGGLVGQQAATGGGSTIANSFSSGTVTGTSEVGGLVGRYDALVGSTATITDSYSSADVTGQYRIGGLVGVQQVDSGGISTIANSHSDGVVTGNQGGWDAGIGGLAGFQEVFSGTATITNSYHRTGLVKNLGNGSVGGLVGLQHPTAGTATITNSYNTADVTGTNYVGGLVGYNDGGTISYTYSTGTVSGNDTVGGLVGENYGSISNSYSTGAVTVTGDNVGGLVGYNYGSISNSYSTGAVSGNDIVGGLVGENYGGTISYTYSTGAVTGTGDYVGGLVGYNAAYFTEVGYYYGSITNSYSTGAVTGTGDYVGGLVGSNAGSIDSSYSTGAVTGTGDYDVGGLVGYNDGDISNSYSTGAVTVTGYGGYVGGLVGENYGSISYSYSTGAIDGGTGDYVGGLVGYDDGSISNSYWDTQTSGLGTSSGGTPKTTAEMMTKSTFTDWDIADSGGSSAVWRIYNGKTYPLLRSFLTPLTITADNVAKTYDGNPYVSALTNPIYSIPDAESSGLLFNTNNAYNSAVNAGSYTPGLYSTQQGYDIGYVNGLLTINPAEISTTTIDLSGSRVYDGTRDVAADIFTLGGLIGEQTLTLTGVGTVADKNVGLNKPVTLGTLALGDGGGGGLAGNYTLDGGTHTASITVRPLTITATGVSKVYDGLLSANVIYGDNRVTGDALSPGGSASYLDKNVGIAKTVNVSGIALGGLDAGNYTFNTTTATSADITPASLSITGLTAQNKVYDATTVATLTGGTLSGVIAGDAVSLATPTGSFNDKNVGSAKPVSVSGLTLSGADVGNYSFTPPTGATLTADITPASLSITGLTAQNKVYDATTVATLTGGTLSGVIAGDAVSLATLTGNFDDKNVGSAKPVSVSGIALTGTDAGNYTLNTTTAATTADITVRGLTVTAATNTKGYDGNTSAAATPTITSGSLAGDDTATLTEVYDSKTAGTGKTLTPNAAVISDGNGGNNYLVTYVNNTTGVIDPGQIVSGMLDVAAAGKTIDFVVNGALFPDQASTDASGNYSMMFPLNSIPDSSALLAYVANDGSVKSASVYLATGGDIANLLLSSNTVTASSGGGTMSNATLGAAKGSLSSGDIPYSVSGTDLTLSPNFNFKTASGTTYSINGSITTTNGAQTYNGPVTLPGNAVISAGTGNISFGGPVTGTGYNFTLNSQGTVTQTAPISVSGLELLGIGGTYNLTHTGNTITTLAGNTGTVNFTNSTELGIGTVNTAGLATSGDLTLNAGGNITLNGLINAGTGNVTLKSGGAIINGMGSSLSISAGALSADAVNGIGSGDPLMTGVNRLTALNTTANNIQMDNTGVLAVIGMRNLGTGDVILQNIGAITTDISTVTSAGGSVSITAHSPLTIGSGGVSAFGNISLVAAPSGGSDDLTINGKIASSNGNITLSAGSSVVFGSEGGLSAPKGTISLTDGGGNTASSDTEGTGNTDATNNTVVALKTTEGTTIATVKTKSDSDEKEDEERKKKKEGGGQTTDDKKTDDNVKKYCN